MSFLAEIGAFLGNGTKTLNTRISALETGTVQRFRPVSGNYTVQLTDVGACIDATSGGNILTITLPTLNAANNGFSVYMRKADALTGTGEVRVVNGANRVMTLFQQHDLAHLAWNGTQWIILAHPKTEYRNGVILLPTTTINATAQGRYSHHEITFAQFTTAGTTENITVEIGNTHVGESFNFYASRNGNSGTKTINFATAGFTLRKSWNGANQAIGTNQFWHFEASVKSPTEIWVRAIRHY